MPGQWEFQAWCKLHDLCDSTSFFQVGPCRGIEMGDHLIMSRTLGCR